uniref:Mediator of RNA polymerase II transcription subunit 32 n=1 Tax=Ananas comosus var. bracteatus TaxID=296719 RepID=A0A6V7NR94_ANACO|nr:unnamed protein product [Ananas comosus var. bracteatus]
MDRLVDEMSEAYKNLAAAAVIEARVAADAGGGEVPRTAAYVAALEELKERWELFGASCDRAEGRSTRRSGAECGLFFPDAAAAAAAAMEEEGKGSAAMGHGVGRWMIVDAWIVVDEEVIEVAAMEKKAEGAPPSAPGSEQEEEQLGFKK